MGTYEEHKEIILMKYGDFKIEYNDKEQSITIYSPFSDIKVSIIYKSNNSVVFFGKEDVYEGEPDDYVIEIVNECVMNRVFTVVKRNLKGKWIATRFFYDDLNPDENDMSDFHKLYYKLTSAPLTNPICRFFSDYTGVFEIYSWNKYETIKR